MHQGSPDEKPGSVKMRERVKRREKCLKIYQKNKSPLEEGVHRRRRDTRGLEEAGAAHEALEAGFGHARPKVGGSWLLGGGGAGDRRSEAPRVPGGGASFDGRFLELLTTLHVAPHRPALNAPRGARARESTAPRRSGGDPRRPSPGGSGPPPAASPTPAGPHDLRSPTGGEWGEEGAMPAPSSRAPPMAATSFLLILLLFASSSLPAAALAPAGPDAGGPTPATVATSTTAAVTTAATLASIGAEVVQEDGCWDTEFRLTCRELDTTIAILDARFHPSTAPAPRGPPTRAGASETTTDAASSVETPSVPRGPPWGLPCTAPPKEWLEAEPWARAVSPDGAPVVDPMGGNDSFPWPLQPDAGQRHFRLALNHRCSGVNHCSFILSKDLEEAGRLWGPGAVRIRYACMRHGRHLVRYCNEEILAGAAASPLGGQRGSNEQTEAANDAKGGGGDGPGGWEEGEGFVASPGYPKYYVAGTGAARAGVACEWVIRPRQQGQRVQVTLLDVSLRGVGPYEQECSDWLEVTAGRSLTAGAPEGDSEDERVLLAGCGEAPEAVRIESPEEAPGLRVALRSASGSLFPKRGLLFHYKALGCRWPPPRAPKDGYLVSQNASAVHYMCCVGFKFPDSGRREREIRCDEQRGLWRVLEPSELSELLPDCVDGDASLLKGNITQKGFSNLNDNSTSSEKVNMMKEADLMFDILIPTIIIGILLIGNGVILFIIFHFKKRKMATEIQEEELRTALNGTETTTVRPSDV
ncbi:uncharacterized protein [Hetaerina americana]|uniref:uncharacterized protein n=1 Tax=Hetaerina americana TaxID=62018 RepID=UPI003A7F2CD0